MTKARSCHIPHKRVQISFPEKGRAKQSFLDETNINNIMAKYARTGLIDHVNTYGGSYADMPSNTDFQTAMNTVIQAQEMFASLPSDIRTRFDNSPEKYLNFIGNPENHDELIEMGVVERPKIPANDETPVETPSDTPDPETPAQGVLDAG